jgi:hypothetical protein
MDNGFDRAFGGQIIDATIVSVPRQRNTKEENAAIKAGKMPEGWEKQPAKNAQKDKDARWTKKNDESFYGYKNHVGVDKALPPAGSARADGACARLSALTGGLRVASCKRTDGRPSGVKTVPDRGPTLARALQPLAQPRQKSPKPAIVRGAS